ncbi:MAG: heterodisulfide reductase-related iron-sulfur binding cluster [Conexivisphaera sp.]
MLDRQSVVDFIVGNMRRTGDPLAATGDELSSWAAGVGIPSPPSDVLLYTGHLYQLVPRMRASLTALQALDSSPGSGFLVRMGRLASRALSLVPDGGLASRVSGALSNAYALLRASGYTASYAGPSEPYSGILLHDLGLVDEFREHAERVLEFLEGSHANTVITLDPHTTYALRVLYPRYAGKPPEVRHILELVDPSIVRARTGSATADVKVHDSCILSRELNLHGRLRELLSAAGYRVHEPERSGLRTFCCGGPLSSLFPKVASEISRRRMEQLSGLPGPVVSACPVCLANMGALGEVLDWLELVEARS